MTILDLIIRAAAIWYVSYALTSTHGPFNVFTTIRAKVPHGGLLDCPVCLSFWVALIILIVPYGIVIEALALAGVAMLLHGFSNWRFAQ